MSDLGTLTASLGIDTRGLGKAETAFRDLEKNSMGRAEKMSKSYTKAFKAIGVAAAAMTAAVAIAFKKSEKVFAEYETRLTDMGKVTDRSFKLINKEIMAMPANLGSASQLMGGYYAVISAGVEGTTRQLDTLTVASKAAKAAHVDQALVIAGLTGIVDAYEGAVKDAAAAADLLFTIEKQGKTTVAELIPYIGQLTSASQALGVTHQELGASFAQITKFSGGTAEAATQYQAVLTGLMKPTEEMIELFKEYGGAQGAIQKLGFTDTLRLIKNAYGGNLEVLSKLLGRKEAVLGFLSLQKSEFTGLTKNIEEFNKMTGASQKAWEDYEKTWASVKETFYNTIGKLAIEWITVLAPDMKAGLEGISDWLAENKADIIASLKSINTALMSLAKTVAGIMKYVGLRSVMDTFAEGAKLASEGLLDWDTFVKASFIERQKMVDKIIAGHQVWRGTIEDVEKASEKTTKAITKTTKSTAQLGKETEIATWKIQEIAEALKEEAYQLDLYMTGITGEEYLIYQMMNDVDRAIDESVSSYEAAQERMKDTTKETTKQVETLWDHALNRVNMLLADTFYDQFKINLDGSLSLVEGFLNSMIRLLSEKLSATLMAELFGVDTGVGSGLTGTGTGTGAGFGLLDALGLAKSGYEMYSGKSLIGQLSQSVGQYLGLAGYGTTTAAGMAAGMGAVGTTTATGAAGTAIGFSGIGSGASSMAYAGPVGAAIAAAFFIASGIIMHNMGPSGPSELLTESTIRKSQDPGRVFQGDMYKIFTSGGTWSDEDAAAAGLRIAGMLADTLDTYNVLFDSLSDASKEAIKSAMGDIGEIYFTIKEFAELDSPVIGWLGRRTPGEITEKEWRDISKTMSGGGWLNEMTAFPSLSEDMKVAIITEIEKGGKLTGEALADIMGVSYDELIEAFTFEFSDGLRDLLEEINAAFTGGEEVIQKQGSIPGAFQGVFGRYFEDYIEEALTNLKGQEIFGWMTDEIQDAINSLDLEMFLSDIDGFTTIMSEHGFQIAAASKIWESLSAFVGRATEDVTAYEVATAKAQIQVAAYVGKMAEFGVTLAETELIGKTKEILESLTDGIGDLEAAAKPLGAMGQLMAALKGQFKAYLDLLEKHGVDLVKVTGLEAMYLEATERLLNEYKIALGLFGPDYAKNLRLEEITEKYKQFGLTHEQMIEAFTSMSLEALKGVADTLDIDWTEIADDIGDLVAILGYVGDAAAGAATNFTALRDQITSILSAVSSGFGGGGSAAALMTQITGLQAIPMSAQTGENLLAMSEKLVQWYSAAVAEAEEVVREEQAVANLLIQVTDRISGLITQIDQAIRNIVYSVLNVSLPGQKAAAAGQDYSKLLSAAQTGGVAEIQEYLQFVPTFLKMQQEELKSSQEYQDIYATTLAEMEAIRARAEAGGYDAAILAELTRGNDQIEADLSGIQATFLQFEGWILDALGTLENLNMIIHIEWVNWTGDQTEALGMLLDLVEVYGWDHEYTLKFLAEVPMHIFEDLNDMANAAGWLADATGGWTSEATLTFLKNVASDWEFEDIDAILKSIGLIADGSGGYGTTATITYIAELMDRFGVPLIDMPYWLNEMGISGDMEIADIMAKLILQAYSADSMIDNIDEFLESIGITDMAIRRNLEVQLMYNFYASGNIDAAQLANWAYAEVVAASTAETIAEGQALLEQVKRMGFLFGWRDAYNVGGAIQTYSPEAQAAGWTDWNQAALALAGLFQSFGMPTHWAEGGLATGPLSGYPATLHGTELIIPMNNGLEVPVKWVNGGSTGRGEENNRPIINNLVVKIGNKEIQGDVEAWADGVYIKRVRSKQLNSEDRFFRES